MAKNMPEAIKFQFQLRKIEEVMPWGTGQDRKLHWFGLTDGHYWISTPIGDALRYTEEVTQQWKCDSSYVDYQVAQIFENIQEVLPYALEPVPPDIAEIVSSPDWYAKGEAWHESLPEDSELSETWLDAMEWWWAREFDTAYLKHGPSFQIWRVKDQITIRWDSREEGESVWLLPEGECSLDVNSFTSSCYAFLDSVIEQMQVRVNSIDQSGWPRKDCSLDVPLLIKEQRIRSAAIQTLGVRRPNTDWATVRERLAFLRQQFE
jgi:hypothetical protein